MLATMPFQSTNVFSRGGMEIHDIWNKRGAPSAYKGMMFPDFPNFCVSPIPSGLLAMF